LADGGRWGSGSRARTEAAVEARFFMPTHRRLSRFRRRLRVRFRIPLCLKRRHRAFAEWRCALYSKEIR